MRYVHLLFKLSLFYGYLMSCNAIANNALETASVALHIDSVTVDVSGIEHAMLNIETQLAHLSDVLGATSTHSDHLTEADKALFKQTITQINQSSQAMTKVLNALPQQIDDFNQQLPQLAKGAQAPMAHLAKSLSLLNQTVNSLSTQTPQLLAQSQAAANNTLDAITLRITLIIGSVLLFILVVLVVSILILNKQVIQPISQALAVMSSVPEQQLTAAHLLEQTAEKLTQLSAQINEAINHKAESNTEAISQEDKT